MVRALPDLMSEMQIQEAVLRDSKHEWVGDIFKAVAPRLWEPTPGAARRSVRGCWRKCGDQKTSDERERSDSRYPRRQPAAPAGGGRPTKGEPRWEGSS
jgi:hypothetical protein